jgi:hypothetical protein
VFLSDSGGRPYWLAGLFRFAGLDERCCNGPVRATKQIIFFLSLWVTVGSGKKQLDLAKKKNQKIINKKITEKILPD